MFFLPVSNTQEVKFKMKPEKAIAPLNCLCSENNITMCPQQQKSINKTLTTGEIANFDNLNCVYSKGVNFFSFFFFSFFHMYVLILRITTTNSFKLRSLLVHSMQDFYQSMSESTNRGVN